MTNPAFHQGITYNPLQEETQKYLSKDCNLVILAPTSSGKTIVIEQFLFSTIDSGQKGIYLSPLKALTEEKKRDWKEQPYSMLVVTGDYTSPTSFTSQLICMTTESLDSKTRASRTWLKKVGCIAVDEAHLLGISGRGDALEVGLIRFTSINPTARIILLSATIPNAQALADWLTKLNGKPSKVISTDYRPVKQEHNFITCANQEWDVNKKVIDTVYKCSRDYPNEQVLIFVHSIYKGHQIAKTLGCPFHYSRLTKDARFAIEDAFTKKKISHIVATSTLAYGINLPADIVIISGANRGPERVDAWDLKQMAGRAGRYGLSEKGRVFYILKRSYKDAVYNELMDLHDVVSVIDERLYFHLVSFIYREGMQIDDIQRFIDKSFSRRIEISKHINLLKKYGIVSDAGGILEVNSVGKAAALMYLNPIDLCHLVKNLVDAPMELRDIAIAFANLPCYSTPCFVPKDLNVIDMGSNKKTVNANCLYQWLTGAALSATASVLTPRLIFDIKRWLSGLSIAGLPKPYIKSLGVMLGYGIPVPLTELVSIPGIGRKRAQRLYEHKITTLNEAMGAPTLTRNIIGPRAFKIMTDLKNDPTGVYLRF